MILNLFPINPKLSSLVRICTPTQLFNLVLMGKYNCSQCKC